MKVAAYWIPRHLTYDYDWADAIHARYGVDMKTPDEGLDKDADLILWLHGLTAQEVYVPDWLMDRKGKLCILSGNDYKKLDQKRAAYRKVAADLVGSLAPNCPFDNSVHIPHGLNPERWGPGREFKERSIPIGFRGYQYPETCGDQRNSFVELFMPEFDVKWEIFTDPHDYVHFLNNCRATVATEAGMEGRKAISSRQFEAIGARVGLIMTRGHYSGCLHESHYFCVEQDFSNVVEQIDRAMDPSEWEAVTTRAREHVLQNHTIDHRLKQIEGLLWP